MTSIEVCRALESWRSWRTRNVEELAAVATAFVWALGLDPQRETTATDQISRRTIRYYVSSGLMTSPEGPTRGATYGYRHLLDLLYIKARQHRGGRLEEIQAELDALDGDAIERRLLELLPESVPPPVPSDPAEFARDEQRHAALQRWGFLTGKSGRWTGEAANVPGDSAMVSQEQALYSAASPAPPPLASRMEITDRAMPTGHSTTWESNLPRHRIHIPIDAETELVLPASHPLAIDDDGREQIVRAMRRLIRSYLSGGAG